MKTKLKNSNKIISLVLALVMVISLLPMNILMATAAPAETSELPTSYNGWKPTYAEYTEGLTQYFKYGGYLYKAVWKNCNATSVVLYKSSSDALYYMRNGNNWSINLRKGSTGNSDKLTVYQLPKTVNGVLFAYGSSSTEVKDTSSHILEITCIGVKAPTWTWSDDKTSATAVFVSEDGKAQVTIGATVTSVEVPADCLNQGKITYTATATCNGQNYTDTYTVYGDVKPHDWSNLDGVCANGCGTVCRHENRTDDVCDVCGYECLHEEKYDVVTVPATQNADGTWTKATISVVCRECESVIEYKEADRADYTEFDKAMARVTELLESGDLTEDKYNHYNSVIGSFKTDSYQGSPFQETADSYADSLEYIVNEIEAGLADGTMKKADWTYMTALLEEVNTLIDNDANNIVPKVIGYYYSPRGFYNSNVDNPNYSQAAYNEAIANNDLENMLETLIAGLKDGTMLKADYTEIDEAIAALDEKLADVNLTDEAKAGLDEIKAELEKLRRNTYASKADLAVLEKALEEYETELDAGIEDGSALKADYTYIDEVIKHIEETFADEYLTDERKAELEQIKSDIEKLKADPDTSAADLEGLERSVYNIFTAAEACFNGYHRGLRYELTEEAKCGKNAVESATCSSCGKVLTREVENTALTHSFTKYEVTEEAKCGVEGKEVATCDYGCGETDEKAIEALTHTDADGDYKCDFDCGYEFEKPAPEEPTPDTPDEPTDGEACPDCGRPAHESEIGEYICLIINIFKLLYSFIMAIK